LSGKSSETNLMPRLDAINAMAAIGTNLDLVIACDRSEADLARFSAKRRVSADWDLPEGSVQAASTQSSRRRDKP
jgi:hypothetical protein